MRNFLIRLLGGVPLSQYHKALKGWKECLELLRHYEVIAEELRSENNDLKQKED